jgi:hypothetical protein
VIPKPLGNRVNNIRSAGATDYTESGLEKLLAVVVDIIAIVNRDAAAVSSENREISARKSDQDGQIACTPFVSVLEECR